MTNRCWEAPRLPGRRAADRRATCRWPSESAPSLCPYRAPPAPLPIVRDRAVDPAVIGQGAHVRDHSFAIKESARCFDLEPIHHQMKVAGKRVARSLRSARRHLRVSMAQAHEYVAPLIGTDVRIPGHVPVHLLVEISREQREFVIDPGVQRDFRMAERDFGGRDAHIPAIFERPQLEMSPHAEKHVAHPLGGAVRRREIEPDDKIVTISHRGRSAIHARHSWARILTRRPKGSRT
jgi:hypothetical protein